MHLPGRLRSVGRSRRLRQRKAVHVRPQENSPAIFPDIRGDTGASDSAAGREAEPGKALRDEAGRARFLEGELGMLVEIAPGLDERAILLPRKLVGEPGRHARDYRGRAVAVCHSEERSDEESAPERSTREQILRFAQDDSKGHEGMTGGKGEEITGGKGEGMTARDTKG